MDGERLWMVVTHHLKYWLVIEDFPAVFFKLCHGTQINTNENPSIEVEKGNKLS